MFSLFIQDNVLWSSCSFVVNGCESTHVAWPAYDVLPRGIVEKDVFLSQKCVLYNETTHN